MREPAQRSFPLCIRAALPEIHPCERPLAEVVPSFPGKLARYSAAEPARPANVPNATVTRFVRKIDYGSFEAARQAARAGYGAGTALFRVSPGADAPFLAGHVAQGRANLQARFAAVPQAETDAVAQAMPAAPRLWVPGFRTAHSLAPYLGAQSLRMVPPVTVQPCPGQTPGEAIAGMRRVDCALSLRCAVRCGRCPAWWPRLPSQECRS